MEAFVSSCSISLSRTCVSGSKSCQVSRKSVQRTNGKARFMAPKAKSSSCLQMVTKVNQDELELELQSLGDQPLIVDFYATWCGPCQFLLPELEKLQTKYGSRIKILKVDSDEEPELCSVLRIRGLPTIMFIHKGELKYRMEGALRVDDLSAIAEQAFFGSAPQ